MAINTQKLVPSSFGSQQVSQKKLIEVKRSVIDVEKLMTGIVAFEKKQQDAQRKSTEEKRYQKRENDLERKTIKKQFKMNLPSLPRMGFFDWIKNFVTNTLLGFFAVRLLKYVPQLVGVAGLALNAAEGIFNFAGGLLNGAATFVEWGYKAYDATRGFLRQIGGENTAQLFDKFLGGLDKFLFLTLGASTFKIGREIIGAVLQFLGGAVIGGGGTAGAIRKFGGRKPLTTPTRLSPEAIDRIFSKRRTSRQVQRERKLQRARRLPRIIEKKTSRVPVATVAGSGGRGPAGFFSPEADRIIRESRIAESIRKKGSAIVPFSESAKFGMTDLNDAILDSIERDPKLSPFEKSQRKARYLGGLEENLRKSRAQSDLEFKQRFNIDTDPELMSKAQFDQQVDSLTGFDPRRRRTVRTGEDVLLDAIERAPRVKKRAFLRGLKRFTSKLKAPVIGGLLDFGLAIALGESPGRAAFKAIGAGLLGGVLSAVGSVVPVAGTLIGGLVGGFVGDLIGGALYDILFENKKPRTSQQNPQGFASGGEVGRGPRKRIKKRREYLSQPSQDPIELGKDVGKKKFEEMFPKGSSGGLFGIGSKEDAYGYLESGFGVLSGTSFFGPLFGIAIKSLTGDKPSSSDYRAASFGLSNWMTSTFGNVAMQGFANGGLVGGGLFLDSRQIQKTIESSLESRITSEVDDAINELRRRLGIEGKEGKKGGGGSTTSPDGYNEKPSSSTSGTGGDMVRSAEGTKLAAELGRFIQSKLSSPEDYNRITEHPEFGGSFKRNYNSWHNVDRAIDIGAYSYEQQKILDAIEEFNKQRGVQPVELLHAGNDPTGLHDDHVHVAYFGGGSTGKGGVIRVHEDEWVVDKDSKNLYGNAFLHLINSTENESQRKQNSLRLMSILQSYAGYESGFEQTVTVPVPTPQMIPVPVPMQSNEPMMMSGGGGSSGRASDILESIG